MITCIIVDDDPRAIADLSNYISNIHELKLLGSFTEPVEAASFLKQYPSKIDILFSDVEMPVVNGLALATLVKNKTANIIFTTSHSKFALEAFEVNVRAYLLKPFSFAKLTATLENLFPILKEEIKFNKEDDFIFIKSKEDNLKLIKVYFEEIIAFESLLNYVKIHTETKNIITHISLKDISNIVSHRKQFKQLHRSFIISINHISAIEGNTLIMTTGGKFTVGERYKNDLNAYFNDKILKPIQKL